MEKNLNSYLMLSLKEICLRKVAVILWSQNDILVSLDEYTIINEVINNIKKLKLPSLLSEKLKYLVQPIELEIRGWIQFHRSYLSLKSFDVKTLQKFYWTNLGTIEYRKSAEKLIHLEMFDVIICYKLACLYCLTDYIPVIWEKFPEETKSCFCEEGGPLSTTKLLEFGWTCVFSFKGAAPDYRSMIPITFNQRAFEHSAYNGYKAATEYFFQKLTAAERKTSLFKTAQSVLRSRKELEFYFHNFSDSRRSDTFCYLLFLMTAEQQMAIFKLQPYDVLMTFLDWPWQDLSLDIGELVCPFLKAVECAEALRIISGKIKSGSNLTELFQTLFLNGPSDLRKLFIDQECSYDAFFDSFLRVRDSETIRLILRTVDAVDRKRLVFSKFLFAHFYESILKGQLDMVELCLREATLSDEDKAELKVVFYKFLRKTESDRKTENRRKKNIFEYSKSRTDYVWKHFLHILEEGEADISMMRNLDEEGAGPSTN